MSAIEDQQGQLHQESMHGLLDHGLRRLAQIAKELVAAADAPTMARTTVTWAPEVVAGCTGAALVGLRGGRAAVVAATDTVVAALESRQVALAEGPTLTALKGDEMCFVADAGDEVRWPQWGETAQRYGVRSVLAATLAAGGERLGVLTFYAIGDAGLSEESVDSGLAYASLASVALVASRSATALDNAVEARHRIGIAQGILMNRYSISQEAAFELLRRYSNESNVKLRQIALWVGEVGDLPSGHRRPRSSGSASPSLDRPPSPESADPAPRVPRPRRASSVS